MSKLTTNDIAIIQRQSDVISRNLRENDANIKAAVNDNQLQIDAITTPVAGNEANNGDFDSDSIWIKGTGWTISGGAANKATAAVTTLSQTGILTIGQSYTVTFTVSNFVGGTIIATLGTANGTSRSANGTYSEEITCTGNTTLFFTADASTDLSIDDVIINGAEIQGARQNADSLRERVSEADRLMGNYVIDGLIVQAQGSPDMTVEITAGSAMIDGVYTKLSADTSTGTITAPTNERYDLIVMNSDNTITIVSGNDSADPDLPAIALSQRPLGLITLDSTTTSITATEIFDIQVQGCIRDNRHWYFSIEDALDDVDTTRGGMVNVNSGWYYEEIDLSGYSNTTIEMPQSAIIHRLSATTYCVKSVNTIFTETANNKIIGGTFDGNSKAGAIELVRVEFTDSFTMSNINLGDNSTSTATYDALFIDNADTFNITGMSTGLLAEISVTNSTKWTYIINGTMNGADESTTRVTKSVVGSISSATTHDTVFDALDPFLPVIGDEILVNGTIEEAGGQNFWYNVQSAIRTSATIITFDTFYFYNDDLNTHTGGLIALPITDGAATTITLHIKW